MKKITIICSNYNSDVWIDDYLKCINNQIDKNFNIIFFDANSSDESLKKIKWVVHIFCQKVKPAL